MKPLALAVFLYGLSSGLAQDRSQKAISWTVETSKVVSTLQKGFHFNLEAPNQLVTQGRVQKPTIAESQRLEFSIDKASAGQIYAYVCDDQNSFCERHMYSFGAKAEASMKPATSKKAGNGLAKENQHGFIENDFPGAVALAKSQKKLLLVDFSARWCPGCVRYEQEVFPTREFKVASSEFVRLKIDMDIFENQMLGKRFGVRAIPTLVILNTEEKEIDRLVDFQPLGKLSTFLRVILNDPTSIDDLINGKQKILSTEHLRIGRRFLAAGKFAEAVEFLEDIVPVPGELLEAKLGLARVLVKNDETLGLQSEIQAALKKEPVTYRSLLWRTELATLTTDAKLKQNLREQGSAAAEMMLADPLKLSAIAKSEDFGEGSGFEAMFIASARAELVEASGAPESDVRAAWLSAAAVARGLKIPTSKTGPSMRSLVIMVQAKEFAEAEKLARQLIAADPANPELQRRLLRALVEQSKFTEAIGIGKKALKGSYGRNELWVVEQLVRAYMGGKKNQEARALLNDYLNRPEINWANMATTRRTLEEFKAKID